VDLHGRILLGMGVGVALGLLVGPSGLAPPDVGPALVGATAWIGQLFLALIRMVVVPLVFCSLVTGVAALGDPRGLGRLGTRTIAAFLLTTCAAVILGIALATALRPGHLTTASDRATLLADGLPPMAGNAAGEASALSLLDRLVALVPSNPAAAFAAGDMLPIIVFALLFGAALTRLPPARARPIVAVLDGITDAMVFLVHVAMQLAPFGVAALVFGVAATTGLSVLVALSAYAGVVLFGLLLHVSVVYGGLARLAAGVSFLGFLRTMRPAILVAFGTASSAATLPVTLRTTVEGAGVSKEIASFVLPLGASISRNGTALFQGVATVFVAQIYGRELSFADDLTIVITTVFASVGAAGVPGAGMITIATVLSAVGLPIEGLALVLGVDRLLDMFRTTVNVLGGAVVAVVLDARWPPAR